jgi:hypothetical protein
MPVTNKTGIAYVKDSNSNSSFSIPDENTELKLMSARVTDIILDETHPKFSQEGGWSSIGTIFFEQVDKIQEKSVTSKATPFLPHHKNYPLVNELVLLFYCPDKGMGGFDSSKSYFYLNPISIWNHPHHNIYPNIFKYVKDKNINFNSTNKSGGEFIEKNNINPIIPFTGDNIVESRFGSSIRLGSTNLSSTIYRNNWSEYGEHGDPILILKNGNTNKSQPGFLPSVENINEDPSSIYMTSTQNIPISASSLNYTAISNNQTPEYPGSYSDKPQIILNSDRLVLNSKSDSILLSSQKIINLASLGDLGLASRKSITLEAEKINIGGTNSSQPAIAGETFLTNLKSLTKAIQGFAEAIAADPRVLPTTSQLGERLAEKAKKFNNNYSNYTSKKVKLS